jgi:hypothetical protein
VLRRTKDRFVQLRQNDQVSVMHSFRISSHLT